MYKLAGCLAMVTAALAAWTANRLSVDYQGLTKVATLVAPTASPCVDVLESCDLPCNEQEDRCKRGCERTPGNPTGLRPCIAKCSRCSSYCQQICGTPPPPQPPLLPHPPSPPICEDKCRDKQASFLAPCADPREGGPCTGRCNRILRACIQGCLPPPPPGSLKMRITLDSLKAYNDGEDSAGTYLWMVVFTIDASSIQIRGSTPIFIRSEGIHFKTNGVDIRQVQDGQNEILGPIYDFELPVNPFLPDAARPDIRLAFIGRVSALYEHDSCKDADIDVGFTEFVDIVSKQLEDDLSDPDLQILLRGLTNPNNLPERITHVKTLLQRSIIRRLLGFEVRDFSTPIAHQYACTRKGLDPDDGLGVDARIVVVADGFAPEETPGASVTVLPADTTVLPLHSRQLYSDSDDGLWRLFRSVQRLQNF